MRIVALSGATILLVIGAVLGYIAVVAVRRNEGVFMPAGYVAAICLLAGGMLIRFALVNRG